MQTPEEYSTANWTAQSHSISLRSVSGRRARWYPFRQCAHETHLRNVNRIWSSCAAILLCLVCCKCLLWISVLNDTWNRDRSPYPRSKVPCWFGTTPPTLSYSSHSTWFLGRPWWIMWQHEKLCCKKGLAKILRRNMRWLIWVSRTSCRISALQFCSGGNGRLLDRVKDGLY